MKFIAALRANIRSLVREFGPQELMLIGGLALLGYGAGEVYRPAGFILPGAVMVYVAIVGLK